VSRRAQEAIPDDLARPGVDAPRFRLRPLAGVLATRDSARRNRRRRAGRTCTLWARVSEQPGSTDSGGPKKVSRRAQAPVDGHTTRMSSGKPRREKRAPQPARSHLLGS